MKPPPSADGQHSSPEHQRRVEETLARAWVPRHRPAIASEIISESGTSIGHALKDDRKVTVRSGPLAPVPENGEPRVDAHVPAISSRERVGGAARRCHL